MINLWRELFRIENNNLGLRIEVKITPEITESWEELVEAWNELFKK
jgi:hypothetical protein